jgi:hypothetical protein
MKAIQGLVAVYVGLLLLQTVRIWGELGRRERLAVFWLWFPTIAATIALIGGE